jgi:hypothetical protein
MGLYRDEDHRYSVSGVITIDGEQLLIGDPVPIGPLVSITTFLGALDKSGPLVGWAKNTVAEIAVRKYDLLGEMIKSGDPKAAQRWLASLPDYQRDTAAGTGTNVHMLAEALANGQQISEEDAQSPKVKQYQRFMAELRPIYVGVEQMVVSFTNAYAGTGDEWCKFPAESIPALLSWGWRDVTPESLFLLDTKTGKGVYPEHGLQLSSLDNAEYWGWSDRDELIEAPKATHFGILHLLDDAYKLIPYDVGPEEFETAMAIKRAYEWTEGRAKSIMVKKPKVTKEKA